MYGNRWVRLIAALTTSVALHLFILVQMGRNEYSYKNQFSIEKTNPPLTVHFYQIHLAKLINDIDETSKVDNPIREQQHGDHAILATSIDILNHDALMHFPLIDEVGPPYPPPLPEFLPAGMLDSPPRALVELDTRFAELEEKNLAGRMVFSLLIDESGNVVEILNEYSGVGPYAVSVVQHSLSEMRFSPGFFGGKAVKSRSRVEVVLSYSVK